MPFFRFSLWMAAAGSKSGHKTLSPFSNFSNKPYTTSLNRLGAEKTFRTCAVKHYINNKNLHQARIIILFWLIGLPQ